MPAGCRARPSSPISANLSIPRPLKASRACAISSRGTSDGSPARRVSPGASSTTARRSNGSASSISSARAFIATPAILTFEGDVLVELGRDIPYIEHWHRASPVVTPHFALRMRDPQDREGFIVRAGDIFIYVRDRGVPLQEGASLPEIVSDSTPTEARLLLDCEISLGRIKGGAWIIERSSLPYRVGVDLAPSFADDQKTVTTADIGNDGAEFSRHWDVVDLDVGAPNQNYRD